MAYDVRKKKLGILAKKSGEDLEVDQLGTNVIEI